MTIGEKIKAAREAKTMTQQELAERLFVTRQTVSRWENGSRYPDIIMAKKISLVLGLSLDELTSGADLSGGDKVKPEPIQDISCVKFMLTGLMLVAMAAFFAAMDVVLTNLAALCFFAGLFFFVVGLIIPFDGKAPKNEELPQVCCPKCGREHDFDYPRCPYCDFDYTAK